MAQPSSDREPHLFWPALLSCLLGLTSLTPFLFVVTGLPALLVGFFSLRAIHRSEGRLKGVSLAVAGMVMGGIGTLISLSGFVLGMMLEAQGTANRVTCQNNLRWIGEAVHLYEGKNQGFPPAALPPASLPIEQRWSWLAGLRPFLPQNTSKPIPAPSNLEQPWTAEVNRPFVTVTIGEFYCPSNGYRPEPGAPAWTHYVGFAGLGPDAARLPLADPNAGFFGFDRTLTARDLKEMRGTSLTAMTTETATDNGPWAAAGPATVRSLEPSLRPYLGPGRLLGGCHRNGLNVLFADGSVTFFRDGYEPAKLEALVTIHGE